MKFFGKLYLMFSFSILLGACNYLDFDESVGKSEDYMYGYFDEAKKLVSHIYGQLPSDWGTIDGALRECATDNAIHVWSDSDIYGMVNGSWSPVNPIDDVWGKYYSAIRSANLFLETFSLDNFDKFGQNEDYPQLIEIASLYPYEVRFLRAFFYFELAKRYGNIPLITDVLTEEQANEVEQTDFDEVISFICQECDEIKDELPVSYSNLPQAETGRITKGACMALKSRATLYAASPLFNKSNNMQKWQKAVDAAWELISWNQKENIYQLVKDEVKWGNGNDALKSKQLILECRGGESNEFEKKNFPIGYEGGNTGTCPSQNLVDAFEYNNSLFDWGKDNHVQGIYSSMRDARLAQTVLYNGSIWKGQPVETFYNGRNGQPLFAATLTGYYLKKYVDSSISFSVNNTTKKPHHYILFRYAEVLLNYAEALWKLKGNANYTDAVYSLSPSDAINEVRKAAGASSLPVAMTPEKFEFRLQNERRVELAFEDHRFWDIRRWMIGPETADIYGIEITLKPDGGYDYRKVLVEKRRWDDKMYLYPISQSEILKNKKLVQTPGW